MPDSVLFVIEGSIITLQYSLISVFFGLVIGTILAVCKTSEIRLLRYFGVFYTSIFRGTPLLIQLSIIYFLAPQIIGIKLTVFVSGVMAFSLNSGAYVSEIIRAGIESVDKGQMEAAKALGLSKHHIMRDIILPQAIRNILPSLVNELVNMLKESAIISVLGEADLMRRAQMVAAETFDYFTPLMTAAISYYILVLAFSSLAKILERRLAL
jgi:polar amino acid transport system permease protein